VTVPLTQGQFDALVSLCFNIGCEAFRKSTVVKRLNVLNYRGARMLS
jgi:lysozyme